MKQRTTNKLKTNDKKISNLQFVVGAIHNDIEKLEKRKREILEESIAVCKSSQKLLEKNYLYSKELSLLKERYPYIEFCGR